jgi:glycosyltransferase involved in cell wall biosynthesis
LTFLILKQLFKFKNEIKMPILSLVIPTYKRYNYLIKHLQRYLNSPYVFEVIICDDCSTDEVQLRKIKFDNILKLKLYTNLKNTGASKNKIRAVGLASSEWALLLDSDNDISDDVLKILYEYEIKDPETVIIPEFAKPSFDFRHLQKELQFKDWKTMDKLQAVLWNTGNYLVNKTLYAKAGNLVLESKIEPGPYDVIYINYFLCKNLSATFKILANFEYNHTVNDGGIWVTTHSKYDTWYNNFMEAVKKE